MSLLDQTELEYKQMLEREKAVVDDLNKKLGFDINAEEDEPRFQGNDSDEFETINVGTVGHKPLCCPNCGHSHKGIEPQIFNESNRDGDNYFYRCDNMSCMDLIRFKVIAKPT